MAPVSLPEAEQTILRDIYEGGDRQALKRRINTLRKQKWSLRAIGEPLGVGRSTVQMWEKTSDGTGDQQVATLSPRAIETAGVKEVHWRTHVSKPDQQRFRDLSLSAQKVRSQTSPNSVLRKDSAELDRLIRHYLNKMVAVTEIAQHMGVTHRAVKARLERANVND